MSDMKCPFCQQELNSVAGTVDCTNFDCIKTRGWYGNKELWQELICIRKTLDVAVNGLKEMTWGCDSSDAEHLLKEITTLEQKDVK